jgi:hypothetical protein
LLLCAFLMVAIHCGFDLHLPHDYWCWAFFQTSIAYVSLE